MITTTLKALRKHKACISGYNKLACHVTGNQYDAGRETYVRHKHDEPISLATVLQSNDLDDALWALRSCKQTPEMIRAERLFGVWCARQVQHLMTDERSIAALDVAERHANGYATDDELAAARDAARDAAWDAARAAARAAAWDAARDAARDAQKQMFTAVFCGDSINLNAMLTK